MRYWNTESPLQPCTSLFDCYVPSRSWALPEKKPGEWEWCLGGSSRFWRKIGAIHQILHLTNANAGLTSKGFIYEAANWETCEVQALLRVYQSASQLLYLTSKGHRPQGPHSIFWLVGHAVFSCKRKKKGEQRDEGRKERGTWRDWGWGGGRGRGWWRCRRVWPVSPGVPVRFIFSVQGAGTAAWWDFQPCGLRCPSIHLEGCRVHSREPATQRHSHKEQPVGQPMPLIWGSQLCSADRPTLSGTHSCQRHRLIPKLLCAQWNRRHALRGSPHPTTGSFKA